MWEVPQEVWLTSGVGEGSTRLNSFDKALFNAGIGNLNLMKVTSILPARAKLVDLRQEGKQVDIPFGCLVPTVYTTIASDIPGQTIACGLVLAVPEDRNINGVIFEVSIVGDAQAAARILDGMAEEAAKLRNMQGFKIVKTISECTVEKGIASVVSAALLIPRSLQRKLDFEQSPG
ncbi:MAG: arginine decarboxylase, pyruvoyl-dependent [Chloroflexi bacterium]|nr:arginine decarboxylase, pyruvoyl-dependent [Chloroflexota bacterium]MDA8186746.1 arginine decarboxylase, pyruvoyl-dependent [Dehalococcoidales bacterium]